MTRLWGWFVARMAVRETGTSMAMFRIGVGLVTCLEAATMWWSGADRLVWRAPADGGFQALAGGHWLIGLLGGPTGDVVGRVHLLLGVASAAVVFGLGTRAAAAISLVCAQALFSLAPQSGGGHDRLIQIGLFFLVLASSDATLSLRCRLQTGAWTSDRLVAGWPRAVLMYQVALMYCATGSSKLGAEWWPQGGYLAVYDAVLIPYWARFDTTPLAWVAPLFQVGAAITVPWETTFPLVLLWLLWRDDPDRGGRLRRAFVRLPVRELYVAMGVIVHGTLLLLMNLGPFTAITWSFYAVLYAPGEWEALGRRLFAARSGAIVSAGGGA